MRCSQSENLIFPLNPRCAELCLAIAGIASPSLLRPSRSLLKIGIGECITPHLPVNDRNRTQVCQVVPQRIRR